MDRGGGRRSPVAAEMSTELSGNVGFFNGRSEVNMAHIRGEYAELVVEASTTERLMAKRSTGPKGVGSLLGFTCGPSEYTLYNFHVQADGVRWQIGLRYSDFVDFDRELRANFSPDELCGLGTLPDRTFLQNSGSPTLIESRKIKLQTYLNRLSNSQAVMRSGLIRSFLSFPEEDAIPVEVASPAKFTPGAYAVCRSCQTLLQTHKDDLDLGVCSVCSRHSLWGSAVD